MGSAAAARGTRWVAVVARRAAWVVAAARRAGWVVVSIEVDGRRARVGSGFRTCETGGGF
jgi:hypothetical protein